jgi:hypothetical protein|tara:strand:- start:889 stop:1596 length:708 start_codon:yes stop_codon:yes gene_type:complete
VNVVVHFYTLEINMFKRILLAASLMTMAGASQAEIVHANYYSGDQMVTVDSDTGLAWMKLDMTQAYDLNTIEATFAEGEDFEGWSVATSEQVKTLWDSFFDVGTYNKNAFSTNFIGPSYGVEIAEFNKFKEYVGGGEWGSPGYTYSVGEFWQNEASNEKGAAGFIATDDGYGHYYSPWAPDHSEFGNLAAGVYIVKDASLVSVNGNYALNVPVGGAVIASLGLIGLAGMRRRKAK